MKLQSASLSTSALNYYHIDKNSRINNRNNNEEKTNRPNKQNSANVSLSQNENYDKIIENIREQIQKVQENEHYDADTKKSKIEELEKQLKEIEKAKNNKIDELLQPQKPKKTENNNTGSRSNGVSGNDAFIVDLSIDAKAIIKAENIVKNIKSAQSSKVKLEAAANVLESEIKLDKGRGVDTGSKEEQLSKMKEGVEKTAEHMGEAVKEVNEKDQSKAENITITHGSEDEPNQPIS